MKTYLIYTKNSHKPIEVFKSEDSSSAMEYFKKHEYYKYCRCEEIDQDTLDSIYTFAYNEYNRLCKLLDSINKRSL